MSLPFFEVPDVPKVNKSNNYNNLQNRITGISGMLCWPLTMEVWWGPLHPPGVSGAIHRTQSEKLAVGAEALWKQALMCTGDAPGQPGPSGPVQEISADWRTLGLFTWAKIMKARDEYLGD